MKKSTRFLSLLLSIVMILGILPVSSLAASSTGLDNFKKVNSYYDGIFTDVNFTDWFYDNVKSAFEYGLMVGKGNNLFDTEGNVTIAETMTIAARLNSIYYTGEADFEQSEPWYQVYADYCKANGIADPSKYDLTVPATRAQFAEILANAMPDEAWESINAVADDAIPDVEVDDPYGAAVYKLYRAGILTGNDSKGTFSPDSNVRRCEVAAIVTRMAIVYLRKGIQLGVDAEVKPGVETTKTDTSRSIPLPIYIPTPTPTPIPTPTPTPTPDTYYTVTFVANADDVENLPTPQQVKSGECAVVPSVPTKAGYVFDGWYTDENLTFGYDFSNPVNADVTLFAKWTSSSTDVTYVVTFNSNGGSAVSEQVIYAGDCAICPAAPVKENCVFENWYSDSSLNTLYDFTAPVYQNITLYANWTDLNVLITIDDGDYADNIVNRTITGTVSANIAISKITYSLKSANKDINDELALDNSGNFEVDVLLEGGENVFTVTVVTIDGASNTESVILTFDSGHVYDSDEVYDETDSRLIKLPIWYSDDTSGDPDEYLVSNILSLYFFDYISFEERQEFITDVIGGEVAGYLNSLDMMQVLLPNPLTNAEEVGYEGETDLTKITEDELYEYTDALIMMYEDILDVVSLEYIYIDIFAAVTTNDPWNNANDDFWLKYIDADEAWEYDDYYNSDYLNDITVGVVDAGFASNHPELSSRIHVISTENSPHDHGTHVSGIIAADADNGQGLAGVIYDNVDELLAYDATSGETMSESQIKEGLTKTVEGGAKVINFSLGKSINPETYALAASTIKGNGKDFSTAIGKLLSKDNDFIVVQSAGNGNADGVGVDYWNNGDFASINESNCYKTSGGLFGEPVSKSDIMDRIIIVAALEENSNSLTSFSNGGSGELNIVAAPGENIYSSVNTATALGRYDYYDGTSMAAPIVTAVCALTWSVNRELSGADIVNLVMDNTMGTATTNNDTFGLYEIARDANGNYMRDANGRFVYVRDSNGNLVTRKDANGNMRIYSSHTTGGMGIVNALASVEAAIETLPTYWGTIADAVTGDPIQAKVVVYKNRLGGDIVGSEQEYYSLENGVIVLPKLPAGVYVLKITAEGYTDKTYTYVAKESATPDQLLNLGTIPMSPLMEAGDFRIVLSWTGEPRDLDSHLVATTVEGNNYHVYYSQKNPSPEYANLDVDDTDYEGPETITITNFDSLRNIRYAVHDYTNRNASSSTVLANSGVKVEVYRGEEGEPFETFSITAITGGTEWDVFAFDAVGNIIPINQMKYCSSPSSVLSNASMVSASLSSVFTSASTASVFSSMYTGETDLKEDIK